jgi:hypothetical protein
MCCGSKRSALSSASTSRLPARAVASPPRTETMPAPVTTAPIPPAQRVDVGRRAAVLASGDPSGQSPQQQNAVPPQAGRRWRLSS